MIAGTDTVTVSRQEVEAELELGFGVDWVSGATVAAVMFEVAVIDEEL